MAARIVVILLHMSCVQGWRTTQALRVPMHSWRARAVLQTPSASEASTPPAELTERQRRRRVEKAAVEKAAVEKAAVEKAAVATRNQVSVVQTGNTVPAKPPSLQSQLCQAEDSEAVLRIVDKSLRTFKARETSTALHRVAARNKRKRARRDVLLRDERLERLFDTAAEQASNFSARCVADVLWSMATLQHFPPRMLVPVLTSVNTHLDREDFEGYHLSTVVWALARLGTKPTRLLERIEEQVAARLVEMNTQNCANLLWGFATLSYRPSTLLPPMTEALLRPGMLDSAKHVEVADIGFALGVIAKPGESRDLLRALAACAAPDTTLRYLSSRQICILIDTFAMLEAKAEIPSGLLDSWIGIVKIAHAETPLLAKDAANLERCLGMLGVDAAWVKSSEMLSVWLEQMEGRAAAAASKAAPKFSESELRAVFAAIDTDNSGDISLDKLKAAVDQVGAKLDDVALARMMSFGATRNKLSVSFDEFRQIMTGETAEAKRVEIV